MTGRPRWISLRTAEALLPQAGPQRKPQYSLMRTPSAFLPVKFVYQPFRSDDRSPSLDFVEDCRGVAATSGTTAQTAILVDEDAQRIPAGEIRVPAVPI